jgi:cellulose biosynthesis protein BcsQ
MLGLERARRDGDPVLFVDLDPQGNLTTSLGFAESKFPGNIALVLDNPNRTDRRNWLNWSSDRMLDNICAIKYPNVGTPIHLVPGTPALDAVAALLDRSRGLDADVPMRLRQAIDAVRPYYGYVFVDTSPGIQTLLGDLAVNAADWLLIPVDGLQAVMGLITVLRRVLQNHRSRRGQGLPPLQVLIYAPRVLKDRNAAPFGPAEVQNADWYPLLCKCFPRHFVRRVVHHSNVMQRAFKADYSFRGVNRDQKGEYRDLYDEIFALIESPALEPLPELLDRGAVDLDEIENQVRALQDAHENELEIRRVQFTKPVPARTSA